MTSLGHWQSGTLAWTLLSEPRTPAERVSPRVTLSRRNVGPSLAEQTPALRQFLKSVRKLCALPEKATAWFNEHVKFARPVRAETHILARCRWRHNICTAETCPTS
jgi:hypothetical protein